MKNNTDLDASTWADLLMEGLIDRSMRRSSVRGLRKELLESPSLRRAVTAIIAAHVSVREAKIWIIALLQLVTIPMQLQPAAISDFHLQDLNDDPMESHALAADMLMEVCELLQRRSGDLAEDAAKLGIAVVERMKTKPMLPIFPTVNNDTASKRGGGGNHVRAELIRAVDPLIPSCMVNRLALIRDLVRLSGIDCSSQQVNSALEYRKRS